MRDDRIQILIVEDEAVLGMYVSDLLEAQGYDVVEVADNGREALAIYQQNRVDLLLCDIHIKGDWDGVETARQIIAFKPVPVIYLTAFSDKDTVERAKQTHPAAYLTKPVRPDNLNIAVDLAIHNFVLSRIPAAPVSEKKPETADKDAGREAILLIDDQVFIKHNYQFVRISLDDILLLEADNTHTHIITKSQKYTLRLTMGNTQQRLSYPSLVRVHRSFVVNFKKVTGFNDRELFIDQVAIPLGAQYKEDFMGQFKFR
ncbi:response regulator [Dyadobacter luticola]|uniref:DNA-binding response regulator n=1 Tax=Dyadobacter luticola TaxID=1979387 RepID=A0A5R9L0X0_9BACT|nr:response regulator [Dyadobacter luticola]TLV02184.1 DNA-binding response regulator [Dyadobacter luticola]